MTYTKKFHCSILQGFPDPINNSLRDILKLYGNLLIKSGGLNAYV